MSLLRPVAPADATALAALVSPLMPYAWTAATFASCVGPDYLGWLLEQNDRIVAVLVAKQQADSCELLMLAVAKDSQGQGYASRLMQQLSDVLQDKGVADVWLEVRASNTVAQAVYQHLGFTLVAERPAYYPTKVGREAALMMRASVPFSNHN